jgi:hypothetical protein
VDYDPSHHDHRLLALARPDSSKNAIRTALSPHKRSRIIAAVLCSGNGSSAGHNAMKTSERQPTQARADSG